MATYKVFRRKAKNFEEFSKARKFTIEVGLSIENALKLCQQFNENRTDKQIKNGTKYEFEKE